MMIWDLAYGEIVGAETVADADEEVFSCMAGAVLFFIADKLWVIYVYSTRSCRLEE